jgi:hypothetical protein
MLGEEKQSSSACLIHTGGGVMQALKPLCTQHVQCGRTCTVLQLTAGSLNVLKGNTFAIVFLFIDVSVKIQLML